MNVSFTCNNKQRQPLLHHSAPFFFAAIVELARRAAPPKALDFQIHTLILPALF
jgi:hypothetical protein